MSSLELSATSCLSPRGRPGSSAGPAAWPSYAWVCPCLATHRASRTLGCRAPWRRGLLSGPGDPLQGDWSIISTVSPLTKEASIRTGADDQVVRLARPDVLERQDAPVPVLVAGPDGGDLLAGLGQGEHPAVALVGRQPQAVTV